MESFEDISKGGDTKLLDQPDLTQQKFSHAAPSIDLGASETALLDGEGAAGDTKLEDDTFAYTPPDVQPDYTGNGLKGGDRTGFDNEPFGHERRNGLRGRIKNIGEKFKSVIDLSKEKENQILLLKLGATAVTGVLAIFGGRRMIGQLSKTEQAAPRTLIDKARSRAIRAKVSLPFRK